MNRIIVQRMGVDVQNAVGVAISRGRCFVPEVYETRKQTRLLLAFWWGCIKIVLWSEPL